MARIYVASSWRNSFQPQVIKELRKRGHKVYDFRHPQGREDKNVWDEVGIKRVSTTGEGFDEGLRNKVARERFEEHYTAMQDADTCILLLPCERSAHVEAGLMAGKGKRVYVMDCSGDGHVTPELMYLAFDGYFHLPYWDDLYNAVEEPEPGVCRICGCTESNPCYHPIYGYCWWVDENHTLCSHCAEKTLYHGRRVQISSDPNTKHCVNDHGNGFK